MAKNYYDSEQTKHLEKLVEVEKLLPNYTHDFLENKAEVNAKTAVAYSGDLISFFKYLKSNNPVIAALDIKDIPVSCLANLSFQDINEYQRFLSKNNIKSDEYSNDKACASRRMSCIRGFFKHLVKYGYLKTDPTLDAESIKIPEHAIIRLEPDEVNYLLQVVASSQMGTSCQKKHVEHTVKRDTAIITLLAYTGMRVSELVGLDINDIDFRQQTIRVVRKGGKEQLLYFDYEIFDALMDYIENERKDYIESEDEAALFLSNRKQRMAVRSVQHMVKKYAQLAIPNKRISPHKMRSTFGTSLYKETGDIRLVADTLGHKDINTTAKHYAAIDEEHRKQASTADIYHNKRDY